MLANKIIRRIQRKFFPTDLDKMNDRWLSDGGDHKFRFDYDLTKDSLVIDLGGYKGQFASDIFSRYQCRIIIFEPISEFAENIRERFLKNDSIEVHQCGLGGHSRKEMIYLCSDSSSLFQNSGPAEEIKIVDIEEWIIKRKIDSIKLMKINIEGAEYELLERLIGTGLITIIENIQVQFHIISEDSVSRMESIQERLNETHLLTYQYRFVWENWKKKESLPDN